MDGTADQSEQEDYGCVRSEPAEAVRLPGDVLARSVKE